jgi:hypothetical protein
MNEYIFGILPLNETVAPCVVKPLDRTFMTFRHLVSPDFPNLIR